MEKATGGRNMAKKNRTLIPTTSCQPPVEHLVVVQFFAQQPFIVFGTKSHIPNKVLHVSSAMSGSNDLVYKELLLIHVRGKHRHGFGSLACWKKGHIVFCEM